MTLTRQTNFDTNVLIISVCDLDLSLVATEKDVSQSGSIKYKMLLYYQQIQVQSFRNKNQGPVVQSVVSLTSTLRVISLTVLADSIYNILIFFAEKM